MTDQNEDTIGDLTSFVTFRMSRVMNKLNGQARHLLGNTSDLSLVDWRILQVLRLYKTTSMTALARDVSMDKGQLSRKMRAMIDKGLVLSEPDQTDQRQQILKLSEAGRDMNEKLMPMMRERQARLVRDISQSDLETFLQVLDALGKAAQDRDLS